VRFAPAPPGRRSTPTLDRMMKSPASREKIVAALQTACICIAVEAVIVLLLGTFMNSYLGAAGVSFLILGPVSWWLAPPIYGYFLRTTS
jgi:hypothetical protein